MDNMELAWAAGLYEGEGTACGRTKILKSGRAARYAMAALAMVEQEPVERFAAAVGVGKVRGPYLNAKHPHWRPRWIWQVARRSDVERVLEVLRPWLSAGRIAQLEKALTA